MDILSKDELRSLLAEHEKPCLSIFMPTVKAGAEIQQNPIQLKNLLREAESRIIASGMRSPEARDLLQPAGELVGDEVFWQNQSEGLALFLSRDVFRYYRLPFAFEEQVIVSRRFHIKSLLSVLENDGRFYVLALSQDKVRLLEGTHYSVDEVGLEKVPKSLAEALQWDDPERQLQWHATRGAPTGGARPQPIFHGHGAGAEDEKVKTDILRYFQKIDRGLQDLLAKERVPLVLAGVEYLFPIYRQANSYQHLVEEGIPGNPDDLKAEDLHARAREILRPYFKKEQQEAADLYGNLAGKETGRASDEIREIAAAAYYGRVDQLFIQEDMEIWGVFHPDSGQVELHDESTSETEDLLDFSAAHTYLNDGIVYVVPAGEIPGMGTCAAVFRY